MILDTIGDTGLLSRAAQVALTPGVFLDRGEHRHQCDRHRHCRASPDAVHGPEHFFPNMRLLSCAATPILDPRGAIVGAPTFSGPSASGHGHALGLIRLAVDQSSIGCSVPASPIAACCGCMTMPRCWAPRAREYWCFATTGWSQPTGAGFRWSDQLGGAGRCGPRRTGGYGGAGDAGPLAPDQRGDPDRGLDAEGGAAASNCPSRVAWPTERAEAIDAALAAHGGNVTAAARQLAFIAAPPPALARPR